MLSIPNYTLQEKLFDSVHSQIYRGYRNADQLAVICKLLSDEHPTSQMVARFQREYYLTERLNAKGFIHAYELLPYKKTWAMILEDIGGCALKDVIAFYQNDIEKFLRFAARLTEILGNLHQRQIIHKDINPSNIIVNTTTQDIQLIDFEIATELSRETQEVRSPDALEGSLYYISPEQTGRMNRSVDYRSDYYSLGVTWYQMLTGQLPFSANDAMEWLHCHIAKTPVPPIELNPEIPYPLSMIVLKLMEKTAEKRYQSSYGLQADLQNCLDQLHNNGRIGVFHLASKDASSHFQIHEKLYGREPEINLLLASFDRVSQGYNELMLIAGYSGIGKSALVHEVHKPFAKRRGYFISGKFDQFKRNIPYDSLFQAFRGLIQQLLTEEDTQRLVWKQKLNTQLYPNGQVLVDVLPEIVQIIGEQPPVPELSTNAARNRFNRVLQNFISTFTSTDQPLVIFLDDLQWADTATLQLLELLMGEEAQRYLFIIGAYRDNEVDEHHPLLLTLKNIRRVGAAVNLMALAPLALAHVSQLIADSLQTSPEAVSELAQLCWNKTRGNPFFLTQLLHTFHRSGAIHFSAEQGQWEWYLERAQRANISDNVVDLMVKKIQQQNQESQAILKLAACVGNQFDLKTLSVITQQSMLQIAHDLWEALQEELVLPIGNVYKFVSQTQPRERAGEQRDLKVGGLIPAYRFIHDRVQQAAYSLLDDVEKTATHLKVGELLLANSNPVELEERLFEIVNHLNIGKFLLRSIEKRQHLAALNLAAGKTAKSAAAYEPALTYLKAGLGLLQTDSWETDYTLSLELYVQATEAAFLNGDYEQMNRWADWVLSKTDNILDQVKVYEIQIQAFMALNQPLEAIQLALKILRHLKIYFPEHPTKVHVIKDFYHSKWVLLGKPVEVLQHLPKTTDEYDLAVMRIMNRIYSAAYIADTHQMILTSIRLATFSVQRGNSPISAFAYASYGLILCGVIEDIATGHRFGRLALKVLDDFNANELKCRTYFMVNNFVWHWEAPLKETLEPLLEAYHAGVETGELEFAGYSAFMYCNYSFFAGQPLAELAQETAKYVTAIDQIQQQTPLYYNQIVLQTILNLRGEHHQQPWMLIGDAYDETDMLPLHMEANDITALAFLYVHKTMLCYWFEEYELALDYVEKVDAMGIAAMFHSTVWHFYAALSRLALLNQNNLAPTLRSKHRKALADHCKKLRKWAHHAPANNAHRYALLQAEQAQLAGQVSKALKYYKQAIQLAQQHGYGQEEALACERYAQFWQAAGDNPVAVSYIKEAYYLYETWGASAKLALLKIRYPEVNLGAALSHSLSTTTIVHNTTSTAHGGLYDFISIIKASRSLSEEIQLANLLQKMIDIAMENAGAQHGLLCLEKAGHWFIEAHSHTQNFTIPDSHPLEAETLPVVPISLIKYVIQTQEALIIDDAQTDKLFNTNDYIQAQYIKSILCIPVLNQGKLIAIIYLENNLSTGVFTADRLEMVQLIASQLAVSIENAHLYAHLEEKVQQRTEKLEQANQAIQALNQRLADDNEKLAEARQAALAAAESKSEFLANMSHEIRTPMNAIIGISDILEETPLNAEQQDYLNTIRNSSNTLLTLINDILDFSKIEAKKLTLEACEFDLRQCVEDALSLIGSKAADKNLNLVYFYDQGVPDSIIGDSVRVQQILVNLLSNATKFTEQGEIQVHLHAKTLAANRHEIQFTVQDTGIGIPNDKLADLFEAFTQAETSTTRKYGGTGLGLTISKHLAELMGGHIWAHSEVDVGSQFHFTIQAPATTPQTQVLIDQAHPQLQGKRLLLMRLLASNQRVITEQITRWGMHSVTDPQQPFDLALIELCQTFETLPVELLAALQDKPVIALTTLCGKSHRQAPLSACLSKPIRPKRLLDLCLQLIEAPATQLPTPSDLAEILPAAAPQTAPRQNNTENTQLRILLVDDNAVNRQVALLQLKKLGYQADIATDGIQAVNTVNSKQYDVVLMDVQMPNMDGLEATQTILNTLPAMHHPWIIAMTANAMKEDRDKCFAAGMHDYVSKPVCMPDLKAALARVRK